MKDSISEESQWIPPQRCYRTLIVDDHVGAAKMLGILFSRLGQPDVKLAHNGQDALTKAQEFCPEIIILDLILGDISGLDVARTLRQLPEFDNALLVALSGNSSPEDHQQTKQAGFDLHLAKPLDVEYVRTIITHCQTQDQTFESNKCDNGNG